MGDTSDVKGCITHGPWGSSEGDDWVYRPEGFITKIIVHFDEIVDAIEFQSSCSNGETRRFGTPGSGNWTHPICIDHYPDEYLISINGTYGSHNTHRNGTFRLVRSICFVTNQNNYGPFGTNTGTVFSYVAKDGVIVGFHGSASLYLNSIGVYVKPKSLASGSKPPYKDKIKNENSSIILSSMAMPREVGPWGAGEGKPWDDGVFSTMKQVRVYLGELNAIYALQFEYQKSDAISVLSQVHGGTNECKTELVNLEVNDEFLIGISGFYGPVEGCNGLEAIVSITFHTNVRTHGPYGAEKGAGYVYFSSTASPGKVLGFHGRNNVFLSAIGVHMEYF